MYGQPRTFQTVGHASGPANQRFGKRTGADRNEQTMARFPRSGRGLRAMKFLRVLADVVGDQTQDQFAQRGKVRLAKEVRSRSSGAVGHIDLALLQSLDQFCRRQVHQFDRSGIEGTVGNSFANFRAGDLPHRIGAALNMLNIERGEHINPGLEQLPHVLPALGGGACRAHWCERVRPREQSVVGAPARRPGPSR